MSLAVGTTREALKSRPWYVVPEDVVSDVNLPILGCELSNMKAPEEVPNIPQSPYVFDVTRALMFQINT